MSEEQVKQEVIVSRQVISIPQRFSTGPVMGYFLKELRDNKRIMANRGLKRLLIGNFNQHQKGEMNIPSTNIDLYSRRNLAGRMADLFSNLTGSA